MLTTNEIIHNAWKAGLAIPAYNIPYLPMVKPVVDAIADTDSFGLIAVARPDWDKFEAKSPAAVMEEYQKWCRTEYVRIHLDHVPVIDEAGVTLDYLPIIRECIGLGFQSVMVDGSRLPLQANIDATRRVVDMAHAVGVPVEAELGAVLGHEAGPLPPYEELFASGKGFTDVDEAARFARDSQCDWLSVAIGNVHGAISGALKSQKKVAARLNLEHLDKLKAATGLPLVLHGGSGVQQQYLLGAVKRGIAKVNIGTEIRQAYENGLHESGTVPGAQKAVYDRTVSLIRDYFGWSGTRSQVAGEA